jgi:hypothetical protein
LSIQLLPTSKIRRFSQIPYLNPRFLLSDFLRLLRNPTEQKCFWRDIQKTWEDWEPIRAKLKSLPPPQSGRRALVLSLTDWPYQVKMECLLAFGLALEGWDISFLVRGKDDRWALRYLQACGFTKFIFWDQNPLAPEQESEVAASVDRFSANCGGFQDVKNWNYRGCWIGPQLLASVSRGIMEGSPDPKDPEVNKRLLKLLPRTLKTVLQAEKILEAFQPDLAIITEANYALRGGLTDAAIKMGINIIQFGTTPRDDALIFRRLTVETRREHPISLTPQSMEQVAAEPWTPEHEGQLSEILAKRYNGTWFTQARNQPGTKEFSRDATIKMLGLDPQKKTAVIFSHVLWDANLFFGKDLFEDYGDWFVQSVKAACENSRLNWIIKLHPANHWKRQLQRVKGEYTEFILLRKHLGDLENIPKHVHFLLPVTPISTPSLFHLADIGITVRGTISAELPCWGKPVLTAGTGRCHGYGFTIDSRSKEEYLNRLAHAEDIPPLSPEIVLLAKKHAHALFLRRPWVMHSFKASFADESSGRKTAGQSFTPVAGSDYKDLVTWARWAAQTSKIDYLKEM